MNEVPDDILKKCRFGKEFLIVISAKSLFMSQMSINRRHFLKGATATLALTAGGWDPRRAPRHSGNGRHGLCFGFALVCVFDPQYGRACGPDGSASGLLFK